MHAGTESQNASARIPTRALELAGLNAPRYTSYPPATQFGEIAPGRYAEWLAALPSQAKLSLYLHVPYCTAICHYCGCHTKATRKTEPVEAYADVLQREIALIGGITGRRTVTHVHWGGGTPSMLGPKLLRAVAADLRRFFDIAPDAEQAFELDPRKVDPALASALVEIGVNRVSLGVQDFSPDVMHAIGRVQEFQRVVRAVSDLRAAGVKSVAFDLMYGLPYQSEDSLRETIRLAANLNPDRLSLFGYAHLPDIRRNQKQIDETRLPDTAARIAQMHAARDEIIAHGYEAIGFDHFALPTDQMAQSARDGKLNRNFQGYTTDTADALIGFGASAISNLPMGYAQNAPDVAGYTRAIKSGTPATKRGFALTSDDTVRGRIIQKLLCELTVDLADFPNDAHWAAEKSALARMEPLGIVDVENDVVSIPVEARPFARLVASAFDAYQQGKGPRSKLI
jgi:oxygen-independent coproporphyrinogen-3 oxidase